MEEAVTVLEAKAAKGGGSRSARGTSAGKRASKASGQRRRIAGKASGGATKA
jgi:hypothetical protein